MPDCILIRNKRGNLMETPDFTPYINTRERDLIKIHLPGGCVAPEIGKVSGEPVVDFV